ncbi:ring-type e3 ubiquitin-protein ligase ppil2 [Anaeramoeba flamelloides]|uniref:Ring-type e3 ubiquitin-protein ligase ppil2 n=1 Tax=Anaeramoeba flamelloides TaxID=1746091 RepID=A0ABQ8YU30_9EUKA|nr:ring-type e3 ubiquitin-protein ligase ppil2 [Anaeramoeba flamelloides]
MSNSAPRIRLNATIRRSLRELEQSEKEKEESKTTDNSKHGRSTGGILYSNRSKRQYLSASLTSTTMGTQIEHSEPSLDEQQKLIRRKRSLVRHQGYATIVTNYGDLNFELFCEKCPLACDNFLTHCLRDYYSGIQFHRLIKGFMIQGGDPTESGAGGESIWGQPFKDEFHPSLTHDKRGILSMANAGKNTNTSQFFITFGPAHHLDNKHTVFGRLVGGMNVLDQIENIPTNPKNFPLKAIKFIKANIYWNPFREIEKWIIKQKEKELIQQQQLAEKNQKGKWFSDPIGIQQIGSQFKVGKYIKTSNERKRLDSLKKNNSNNKMRKVKPSHQFEDFSAWK